MDEEKREQTEEKNKKELILFGRDVAQMPCFRNSMLYGITGGLSLGLVNFLFTSKVLGSANFSVYSFSMITIVYWMQCRYNYSKTKFKMLQLQDNLRRRALLEGVEDPSVIQSFETTDV